MKKVPGVDQSTLHRYVDMRTAIAKRADRISNLTYILSLLNHCDQDTIPVSPKVLASVADQINSDICSIQEQLDEFIYILDTESALEIHQ